MKDSVKHIAICSDEQYMPYCSVLIKSICENNTDDNLEFHVVTGGVSSEAHERIQTVVSYYGKKLSLYTVNLSDFKDCHVRKAEHITVAAYFRLQLPEILPADVKKVLYLDCDIVVDGSISPLFDFDLTGKAVGAVYNQTGGDIRHYNRLNLDFRSGYFNAGVLMINLDYWRKNNVSKRVIDFISENPDICKYHDQDGLNYVLRNEKVLLPLKYNVQALFYLDVPIIPKVFFDELEEAKKSPVIIHYTGSDKPWQKWSNQPNKERYMFYAMLNPLVAEAVIRPSLLQYAKHHIKKIAKGIINRHVPVLW